MSDATNGDFLISARIRSSVEMGDPIGDEARASFVVDGTYWAAAGFIRDQGRPWFSDDEMRFLASLSPVIAEGFRRAVVTSTAVADHAADDVPGVVVLDDSGHVQSISPQAERWLIDVVEVPPASSPVETRVLQAVAARARQGIKGDANGPAPRARAQTRSGRWLLLYGTGLSGELEGRVAVIIQPAGPHEVAPLVAQAYALSEREREIARGCFQGLSTRNIALALHISPYTVQDHLKSIFDKTGTRSRAELVAQVFLEHYVPRWEKLDNAPRGWNAQAIEVKRGPS